MVIVASLFLSTSGLVTKLVFDAGAIAPKTLAAIRVYGAALVLSPIVVRARPRLDRRGWLKVAAFGVFGISVPQWIYFEAISRIPVPIALIIIYTAPVIVTVFERVVHQRRLAVAVYVAIAVAVGGVILAVSGGAGGTGALPVVGVVLAVITAFAYAAQIAVVAMQPKELAPIVRTGVGMMAGSLFWILLAPPWSLPFGSIGRGIDIGTRLTGTAPLGLLVLGIVVFGTVVPYVMLVAGTPRIGLSASSVTGMIEPVCSSILFWVLLGQNLSLLQSAGVTLALASVTVAEILRNRHVPAF